MNEKETQNQILEYLKLKGIMHWRQNSGAMMVDAKGGGSRFISFGFKGISDILGCMPDGKFFAIEVKSEKGRLTDSQKTFLANVEKNNGVALVARSLDDVIDAFDSIVCYN